MAKKQDYGNESITMLKGADKVRKRPAVIFGSDGLDGCEHSIFEVISNSIDEAREGYGNKIVITHYRNHDIEVEDFGRGCPVDFNNNEKGITGSLSTASFTQAVSMTIRLNPMNTHSDLTVWDSVQRSLPLSSWTSR